MRRLIQTVTLICLICVTGCSPSPANTSQPAAATQTANHVRLLHTAEYVGARGAVIFALTGTSNGSRDAIDRIIRTFVENGAPLDVAIAPSSQGNYNDITYLRNYLDAGIIDVSIDGTSVKWPEADSVNYSSNYTQLQSELRTARNYFAAFFGDEPVACIFPSEYLEQENYQLVQDVGFKIISTSYAVDEEASIEPRGPTGNVESSGLYRLPIAGTVELGASPDAKQSPAQSDAIKTLIESIQTSQNNFGVSVIEIQPASVLGRDNKPDNAKLGQLSTLVKICQTLGEVTTFNNWYKYKARWAAGAASKPRVLPAYNGGQAIIFRIDDVSVGWHEDVVEAIINLFQKNGVPVDLGIVSNIDGTNSFEIPWLQKYIDQGAVGISVHGYEWTYYQFDTTQDLKSREAILTDTCNLPGTALQPEIPEEKLTYAYIKFKLMTARDQYLQYFGVKPVALTVPTDFYDQTGYQAIQDAGFKVFSTQTTAEPHPSIKTVDYFGRNDQNGMYRIPTATDVCVWDNCTWGDVFDISRIMSINNYCRYHSAWDEVYYNDFGAMLCGLLGTLGVAAIGIHPDAFVDIDGKPNQSKLDKLDIIIKYCKTIATITTFEQWYNYTLAAK